jgi:TonB family protein
MRRLLLTAAVLAISAPAFAQGQRIPAKDGDLVTIDGHGSVRVVRRNTASVRAVFNRSQRWLLILADYAAPNGSVDGGVDVQYTFTDVVDWPAGERWEGKAVIEEYFLAGELGNYGIGLALPTGFVQLLDERSDPLFRDASAVTVLAFRGSSRGGRGNQRFDAVESVAVANATRNAEIRANLPAAVRGASSASSGVTFGTNNARPGYQPPPSGGSPPPSGPVRIGGNIRKPVKIQDAEPVMPPIAVQAGIRGIVIVEITIGPDGGVKDAKILRSIPLLDQAALEAVRNWRYEPTHLNGAPVAVIMTETVTFK